MKTLVENGVIYLTSNLLKILIYVDLSLIGEALEMTCLILTNTIWQQTQTGHDYQIFSILLEH